MRTGLRIRHPKSDRSICGGAVPQTGRCGRLQQEIFADANDAPDSRSEVFSQPILVYETVVPQEVTSEDVVSLMDAMSQKFTVVTPSEKWSAHQKADVITSASPSTENESGCTLEPVRVVGSYPTR